MQTSFTPPHIEVHLAEEESLPGGGMHPYEAVDPFTSSIAVRIRNNQRRTTISSVDDIGPPRAVVRNPTSSRTSKETIRTIPETRTLEPPGSCRSSLESNASQAVDSHHFCGEAPDYNRSRAAGPHPPPHTPQRRNAIDMTIMDLNHPPPGTGAIGIIPVQQQSHQELHSLPSNSRSVASSPVGTRSTSPASYRERLHVGRGAPYANFSEAFLPVQTDLRLEKVFSPNVYNSPKTYEEISLKTYLIMFFTSILPRQMYLHCLLRLPYMYFSRVDQIFVDAQLTLEEIKEMALRDSVDGRHGRRYKMPKAYSRLKKNWEDFIDNLMREWKTLNIISGLLLS